MENLNEKTILLGSALLNFIGISTAESFSTNTQSPNNKLISSHSRTQEQNYFHQKYCNQIGGVDITDSLNIEIGQNTIDAVFCKITDENKLIKTIPYASSGTISSMENIELSDIPENNIIANLSKLTAAGTFQAIAANGTVLMYQPWYCTGVGQFNNVNTTSSIKEEAPSFGCSAFNSSYVGSGTLTATIMCSASQGVSSTYNYATACVNGNNCVQSKGIINFK